MMTAASMSSSCELWRYPMEAETTAAMIRMSTSRLRNCSKNILRGETLPTRWSSLGPYLSSLRDASSSEIPSGEELARLKASSTVRLYHSLPLMASFVVQNAVDYKGERSPGVG